MSVGTAKELGMNRANLEQLIVDHGGELVDEVGCATFMIAPESEITKY